MFPSVARSNGGFQGVGADSNLMKSNVLSASESTGGDRDDEPGRRPFFLVGLSAASDPTGMKIYSGLLLDGWLQPGLMVVGSGYALLHRYYLCLLCF